MTRLGAALLLFVVAGCAPVTMSPMAIRMRPEDPQTLNGGFGLRAGPRFSAPATGRSLGGGSSTFMGDKATFSPEQWAAAFDFLLSKALTERTSIYLGAQGEFYYVVPLPAYGLYGGVSQYYKVGRLGIGPTLTFRGATDFGLSVLGASGSIVGAEASCSFGHADDDLPIALVPFYGRHGVWTTGGIVDTQYAGAAFAAQFKWRLVYFELTAGFGRVFETNKPSWNAPIIGFRVLR